MKSSLVHQYRTNMGQRSSTASLKVVVPLLELLTVVLWWCLPHFSSPGIYCSANKDHGSPSMLHFSYFARKAANPPAAANTKAPIILGTRSNQHRIAAWVPKQASRCNRAHRFSNHRPIPCVGYYIPVPSATDRSGSALYSRKLDPAKEFDAGDENDDEEKKKYVGDTNTNDRRRGFFSFLGDFRYGVNRVHKDFVGLSWNVYSKTYFWTAPFVVLLFIILPRWSSSTSPTLQVLATKIQNCFIRIFDVLADGARKCFVHPVHALAQRVISWCFSAGTSAAPKSAWKSNSSTKNLLLWALFFGPIVEELYFRLAFRRLWKVLFRPITIGRNNNGGKGKCSDDPHEERVKNGKRSASIGPRMLLMDLLSSCKLISRKSNEQKPVYTNRSWRIASGIFFAIAHFPNFFPILPSKYTVDGEIRLPSGTAQERFLLQLFPGDFASQAGNKEFCLASMALIGAIYQAMHCFITTMVLYGPLLDSKSSTSPRHGGILAAIGAHIAWNANVIWLYTNVKLRLLLKNVVLPLFQGIERQRHKKQSLPESNRSSGESGGHRM